LPSIHQQPATRWGPSGCPPTAGVSSGVAGGSSERCFPGDGLQGLGGLSAVRRTATCIPPAMPTLQHNGAAEAPPGYRLSSDSCFLCWVSRLRQGVSTQAVPQPAPLTPIGRDLFTAPGATIANFAASPGAANVISLAPLGPLGTCVDGLSDGPCVVCYSKTTRLWCFCLVVVLF
jgi:hypothetical protein